MRLIIITSIFISIMIIGCSKKETVRHPRLEVKPAQKVSAPHNVGQVPEIESATPQEIKVDTKFDNLSTGELWAAYKKGRADAASQKKAGNLDKSIVSLLTAAKAAEKLDRPDLASWQYNNAGKQAIDAFRNETDYTKRMGKINTMKSGTEKIVYLKETRAALSGKMAILKDADKYLNKAEALNKKKRDKSRTRAIASNQAFIEKMKSFLDQDS